MKINPLNFLVFAAVFFWCSSSSASYFAAGMDGGVARFSSVEAKVQLQYLLEKGTESTPTSAPQTKRVTVPTGRASLKNLLKLKKLAGFTPLGIGLTAAGFLVDELGELVFSDPDGGSSAATHSSCTLAFNGNTIQNGDPHKAPFVSMCSTSGSVIYTFGTSNMCAASGASIDPYGVPLLQYRKQLTLYKDSGNTYYHSYASCSDLSSTPAYEDQPLPSPVTDQQFDDEVLPKLDWPFIASSPDGSPVSTPELTAATDAVNNWYNNNYTQNTNTTNTTTTTTTPTGSESTSDIEWPAFCGWASIMCDLANYIMDSPAEPQIPVLPVENIVHEEVEWSSRMGSGSCPSAVTTSFMGQSIVHDWADECAAVTSIFRPILLFISLISAGFIVAGVRE